jgi:mRNA turnover protein 4
VNDQEQPIDPPHIYNLVKTAKMPKSKRAKVVHLTQVDKKDKAHRQKLYAEIQEAASNYSTLLVFSVENMRNTYLKEVRSSFADSRLFYAKTKIMAKALGLDVASEHLPGLSGLSKYLKGDVGLLCTPRPAEEVVQYFEDYSQTDFARAGIEATYTFTIPAGVVYSRGGEIPVAEDVQMPHSVEVTLRKWGMPTKLDKGKVMLNEPYTVCREGEVMNSHQTALLKIFGVAMAEFRIKPLAYWVADSGKVTVVDGMEE